MLIRSLVSRNARLKTSGTLLLLLLEVLLLLLRKNPERKKFKIEEEKMRMRMRNTVIDQQQQQQLFIRGRREVTRVGTRDRSHAAASSLSPSSSSSSSSSLLRYPTSSTRIPGRCFKCFILLEAAAVGRVSSRSNQILRSLPGQHSNRSSSSESFGFGSKSERPEKRGEGNGNRRTKQLEKASEVLQTIIDEVSREYFIEQAALIVEDDEREKRGGGADQKGGSEELAQIARKVVKVYMDKLDNVFLAALLAYMQAAKEQEREDVVELLNCIYEQIILLLRKDLPTGVQVVDILTQVISKQDRMNVMRKALALSSETKSSPEGEGEGEESGDDAMEVPACEPLEIFGACRDMLLQMESQEAFDKLLYYRVCCVREEARDFADSGDTPSGGVSHAYPHAFPPRELALVKELLQVSDATRVSALLKKSFTEFDVMLQVS